MHVLIMCLSHDSVSEIELRLKQLGATVHYAISTGSVIHTLNVADLSRYAMIVITPIYWNIGPTQQTIACTLKKRFDGILLGVSTTAEGRDNLINGGCSEIASSDTEACERITDLLQTTQGT
jgi:hypothetical protein